MNMVLNVLIIVTSVVVFIIIICNYKIYYNNKKEANRLIDCYTDRIASYRHEYKEYLSLISSNKIQTIIVS
jgi:hypothetical protein